SSLRFRSWFSRARHPERSESKSRDPVDWRTASRHRQSCKNSLNDGLTRHRLSLGLIADDDAMAQHVRADALHVLRRDVASAVKECVRARTEGEINGGARRSAVANQSFQPQIVGARSARGPDHVDNVIFHAIV